MHRGGDPSRVRPDTIDLDVRYLPEAKCSSFGLMAYWVDESFVIVFSAQPISAQERRMFFAEIDGRQHVLFLVHPAAKHLYVDFLKDSGARPADIVFRGSPTASTRTLLTWVEGRENEAFFAKLSVPAAIGNVVRTLSDQTLSRSVGVTSILDCARSELPSSIKFLRDSLAVIPRGAGGFGFLVRHIPEEVLLGRVDFVPLFSLYSRSSRELPWLARLIETSRMSTSDFLMERLLAPFAQQWVQLVVEEGVIPEPHAQNLLIEFDHSGRLTGTFVHRDMESLFIDMRHRHKAAKPMPTNLPLVSSVAQNYSQFRLLKRAYNSVHRHFQGTILYEIDRLISEWKREGVLSTQCEFCDDLESAFVAELERVLGIRCERAVHLNNPGYPEALKAAIVRARRMFLETRPARSFDLQSIAAR